MSQSPSETSSPEPVARSTLRARRRSVALGTTAVVSFALTLLAGSIAVLAGAVPLRALSLGDRLDVGALLFLMPIIALVLAVIFEASRIALTSPDLPQPRRRQAVRWSPGRREG